MNLFSETQIIGVALAVIVVFIITLDRMGFKFTREKKEKQELKTLIVEKKECFAHKELMDCIQKIKRQQTINIETLNHHAEKFDDGKCNFEEIQKELKAISKNVGNLYKNIAVIAYALKINPNELERQEG